MGIPVHDNWQLPALAEHGKQDLCFLPQSLMVFIKPLNQKPLSVPAFLLTLQNCRYQADSRLFWQGVEMFGKLQKKPPCRVPF